MGVIMDRKIKVMHFAVSAGGVKRHILDIAAGHDRSRFEMIGVFPDASLSSSVAGDMENRYRARFRALGLACHVLEVPRELSPGRDLASVISLVRLLRRHKPDVLHCHSSKAGLIGRVASLFYRSVSVCFTPHVMYYSLHRGLRRFVYLVAEKALAPFTNAVIAVSKSEYDEIARDFRLKERLRLINNGVLPVPSSPDTDRVRTELGLTPENIVLLSPTRCEPQKDVRTLLLAMSKVRQQEPGVKLLVAGEGPQRNELEALSRSLGLEDCVRFLGWVDDMQPLMEAADIVVLSSVREGMPYALLEAAAMGKPTIGSRVVGTQDCIGDNESGFLVPCGDADAFAEKIIELCRSPHLRASFGEGGKKLVAARFHRDIMIKELESLYLSLAEK